MHAAVHNGADAIYLGGKTFGARAFAQNFTDQQLVEVINYAHEYNVKVYITVNTLIKDEEITNALEFVEMLHKNNVDAIILQDIGLANLIKKMYPNLELHASTQMHNLDKFSIKFLKQLGFKRVVLARETSLKEINNLNSELELEGFIHGALCMSYSGQCLLSSMAMNRSGNRGACSQLCRMPYKLYVDDKKIEKEGEYLLSPKDLNSTEIFDEIMESNLHSLKIEGRMKSAQYVAVVTRLYRKLIDAYYSKKNADISSENKALKQLFNRGYTLGHLKEKDNYLSLKRGNHQGVKIGEVINITDNNITIKLTDTLYVGDGIKFDKSDLGMNVFNIYKNREIIKEAFKGDIINVPNKLKLKELDTVLKTDDVRLNNSLKLYEEKKINLNILVEAKLGKPLKITMEDEKNSIAKTGEVVTKAENKEITKDDIISKVTKLGSTLYKANNVEINKDDNIFVRLSDINNLRREIVENLIIKRKITINNFVKNTINYEFNDINSDVELSVFVRNESQLNIVKKYPVKRIYTSDYELYKNNKDLNIFYEVNTFEKQKFNNDKLLVNSTSDIIKYADNTLQLNYNLNVFNSYTLDYLNKYGICTFSPELNLEDYKKINRKIINGGELLIYGKVKVMTMKNCAIFNKPICDKCNFKDSNKYLLDSFNRKYHLTCHEGINYLYHHKNIMKIIDLREYEFLGIRKFRIDFFDEKISEINNILNEYIEKIH